MSYLVLFCSHVFQSFSLGEERANLSSFREFFRFVLVWFCWLPLPLGVCEGLRFVIVALLGLFSYLLLILSCKSNDLQKLLICVKNCENILIFIFMITNLPRASCYEQGR